MKMDLIFKLHAGVEGIIGCRRSRYELLAAPRAANRAWLDYESRYL